MSDLEIEIFGNKEIIDLLKKNFKKIKKIKKKNIEIFTQKYETELKKIAPKRNWQVWLSTKKKKYESI